MDDGAVEIREEERERREEVRRLTVRFFVAVALKLFTGVWERAAAGLDVGSDPKSGTENGRMALYWASKFNSLANASSRFVIFQIIVSTVVMPRRRMRNLRSDCDMQLLWVFFLVMISLSFSSYLRWFV